MISDIEAVGQGPHWCCPRCEVEWRGRSERCFSCGWSGVRWDGKGPEGWPVLTTAPREAR